MRNRVGSNDDRHVIPGSNMTAESIRRFKQLMEGDGHCGAHQGSLRCTLDAVHRELGTACLDRSEDGVLTYWRAA